MLIYIDAPPVLLYFNLIGFRYQDLPEPLVMAFSLVPSCFHGYLTSSSFSSTTHFLPTSLSCGGVSVSPVSKLRTCAKFDMFQGDSPLEQTTSASASQEVVPLEAEDPPEEEEDDRFSNTFLCYKN